jgi:isocitrate lyase
VVRDRQAGSGRGAKICRGHQGPVPGQDPGLQLLPSFNWKKNLDDATIARFQQELSDMGYKYQFITLAGIHNMWFHMYELAYQYARGEGNEALCRDGAAAGIRRCRAGYTFVAHQQEVGTGYFDKVTTVIQGGQSSVTALTGSTEKISSTDSCVMSQTNPGQVRVCRYGA